MKVSRRWCRFPVARAGVIPSVQLLARAEVSLCASSDYDIPVSPGGATEVLYPEWDHAKRESFSNTTASGADMKGNVNLLSGAYQVERMTTSILARPKEGGGDIRLQKTDNTPISYEIEGWDPVTEHAEVWVRIDTVYGKLTTPNR